MIDQVYYKVFLDHVHLGMFESGQQFNPVITFGSFQKEVDWIFYSTTAVALAGAIWFARALVVPPAHPRRLRRIAEIAGVVALIGLPAYSSKRYSHINEHPLLGIVSELTEGNMAGVLARQRLSQGAPPPASNAPEDHNPLLAGFLAATQPRNPQPNLVLIVMESVGALNLLGPDGLPQEKITPNLAMLAQHGVVFNSVYTTFPGTTRSLISLHTGGQQLTYGGMSEVYRQYQGPLLARAIGEGGYSTALFSSERLDGEGTDVFLEHAGYQKFYDFARDIAGHEKRNMIHSWGAREEYTLDLMKEWLADTQVAGKRKSGGSAVGMMRRHASCIALQPDRSGRLREGAPGRLPQRPALQRSRHRRTGRLLRSARPAQEHNHCRHRRPWRSIRRSAPQ